MRQTNTFRSLSASAEANHHIYYPRLRGFITKLNESEARNLMFVSFEIRARPPAHDEAECCIPTSVYGAYRDTGIEGVLFRLQFRTT
jgi:hypothetical protein